jgi:hypothetical protein
MQNDYRRLVRAFDKSTIANFPSHEVELGENTRDSSATGCHDVTPRFRGSQTQTRLTCVIGLSLTHMMTHGTETNVTSCHTQI